MGAIRTTIWKENYMLNKYAEEDKCSAQLFHDMKLVSYLQCTVKFQLPINHPMLE